MVFSVKALESLQEALASQDSTSVILNQSESQAGEIALYHINNLKTAPWSQTWDGQYAQAFLTPLIEQGVSQYIENVQTDLQVLVWKELVLPITVNNAEYENSYVCSPHSFFISYAKESLGFLPQVWLRYLMGAVLGGLGKFLRKFHINKVVTVNNWLFSTNLYPQLQPDQIPHIVQFLKQSFPDHAIVFRSVDPHTSPVCYETLRPLGFEYIATRQIFFLETLTSTFFESRLFKSDLKLLKNSGYEIMGDEQLCEADIPRLLELYRNVYIDKYSDLNPKFNENFLRLVMKKKLMHFKAIRKDGRIDGVVGYVQRNGKMYCPFFGYDCHAPKEIALYRLVSTVLMLEAYERRLFFHQSSGASMFKTIRKAQSGIEYTAVFYKHLKMQRQLPWLLLKSLYNSLGKIYMKRY